MRKKKLISYHSNGVVVRQHNKRATVTKGEGVYILEFTTFTGKKDILALTDYEKGVNYLQLKLQEDSLRALTHALHTYLYRTGNE